ncbi:MAG: 30S ribosomal protein S8e [Candidatus Aenigmatarchaeota archaeon]
MPTWRLRSARKPSGGLLQRLRKKRRMDRGGIFLETKIDDIKKRIDKVRGGGQKIRLFSINYANVAEKGKVKKVKILSVVENPANPNYVRRNVITKGAVIKTELGLARVTSRPCQDGIVNAVLIREK